MIAAAKPVASGSGVSPNAEISIPEYDHVVRREARHKIAAMSVVVDQESQKR